MTGTGAAHQADRRWARAEFAGLAVALLMLVAWSLSGLDLVVEHWFGGIDGFAWQDRWFTRTLLHDAARNVAWGLAMLLLLSLWRPPSFAARLTRRERLWWLLTTVTSVLLVLGLRHFSRTSCPWSLTEFGGTAASFVPTWWTGRFDGGPGQCFPSAHASAGFAFVCGWHALRAKAPRAAGWWLGASVFAGCLLSAVQVVRGAHFVSHCLWSAWLCWAFAALAFHAFTRIVPSAHHDAGAMRLVE